MNQFNNSKFPNKHSLSSFGTFILNEKNLSCYKTAFWKHGTIVEKLALILLKLLIMNTLKNIVKEVFTKAEEVIRVHITIPEIEYQTIPLRPQPKFPKRKR